MYRVEWVTRVVLLLGAVLLAVALASGTSALAQQSRSYSLLKVTTLG